MKQKRSYIKNEYHFKLALLAAVLLIIFLFAHQVGNGTIKKEVAITEKKDLGLTPLEDFFVVQKGITPKINVNDWDLEITGLVNNPVTLTYDEVLTMESVTEIKTVRCVQSPERLSATGKWKGVKLNDLFDLVKVKPEATRVVFYAADDYSSSLKIQDITDEFILAYEVNDEVLPIKHGYPIRLVAPNKWGYKWVKWIIKIELIDEEHKGYWESRGWNDDADVSEKYIE